jgi:hypothetical protein
MTDKKKATQIEYKRYCMVKFPDQKYYLIKDGIPSDVECPGWLAEILKNELELFDLSKIDDDDLKIEIPEL